MSEAQRAQALQLAQSAMQALSRGDANEARRLAETLVAKFPKEDKGHQVLGMLALRVNDHAKARTHFQRANIVAPNQPQTLNALGAALRGLGDFDGARRALRRAGEIGWPAAWRNLGNLELAQQQMDAAVAAYEKAVRADPKDGQSHASLADALERKHDLAGAKASAEEALRCDANNELARVVLGQILLRDGMEAAGEDLVKPVAARGAPINRAVAWGVIGDACDKTGRHREAFAAWARANEALSALHRSVRDDVSSPFHPDSLHRLAAFAEAADPKTWASPTDAAPAPIFLVGFPRSGTTLLDQILSSHSGFFCLEEKECLSPVVSDLVLDSTKLSRGLASGDVLARRARYRKRVGEAAGGLAQGRVIIDKLPLNLVFAPLIALLFPTAKIIFALRDPRDVVLSCFQQRFLPNVAMAQFQQLDTAAAYYDIAMRVFAVSRERLGLNVHVVRYEDVVGDIESTTRGLASFLNAPFEPSMLAFRETALNRTIATPSLRQVVQPLYGRSAGRWRPYAEDLAPVLPTLTTWAERFGYAT